MTPRSRALVLTNPNNPDGHLPSRAEIDELLALASRHDLTVITDEAYERCIHEGELASAWGAPNVILIRSLGKSLAMPAWRIGFVAAEPSVIDACLRELEWDVIRVSHVAQRAATAALDGPQGWLDEVAERLSPRPGRSPRHDRRAPGPERRASGRRRRSSGSSSASSRRRTSSPRASRSSTAPPSALPVTRGFRSEASRRYDG